jgi:hypothetical protein
MAKSSKFAPKTYEDFFLGYDSNSRAYRVFNVTTSCVEITCDTLFDETNGSQKEQVDLDLVDDCDRTTSEMRGLSPKIVSGDSRRSENA